MVLFQQLCRFGLCDVLFAQKSTPNSLCKCDTLAFVLSQLNIWHPPKNAGNILPRLCRVCNLMDTKLSYTACDLRLQLTRPPSFKDWTCIKQEPGTENIDMYPKKRPPNANQKSLVCYLPLMVLFKQLCRFRLCDVLLAQKSTPNSLCKCDTLAFVLSQLNLWHPPKNVGNILPRLCRVWNLKDATHSYTACDLLLQLTRPPSFRYWTCIKQELALKTSTCILKSGLKKWKKAPKSWIYLKCLFRPGSLEHTLPELFSSWHRMAVTYFWQI